MINLSNYTNGVGHLVMSLVATATGLALILAPTDASTKGVGVTLIMTVQGYWFVSGSAKQVASEVVSQMGQQAGPESTTVTQVLTAVPKIVTVPIKEDTNATT